MGRGIGKGILLGATAGTALLAWIAAPALSLKPYAPEPRVFSMNDPGLTVEQRRQAAGRTAARIAVLNDRTARAHSPQTLRAARTYRSGVLRAPHRFNLVGLTWRGRAAQRVWLRVRAAGSHWSPWREVAADPDDAPDAGSGEAVPGLHTTQPAWAGDVDFVQYRLRGRLAALRDLRLRFVNSAGTTTPLERLTNGVRRSAHAAFATVTGSLGGNADAAAAPNIISRADWGASQCEPRAAASSGEVKLAFVHHTVSLNDYAPEDSAAIVLGICRYHRDTNGWNDIGYNFLVDKYGQVFEGRAGGIDQAVVGAQAQGYNSVSTGIANIGEFSSIGQTPAGLAALEQLIAWKLGLHGVPPQGNVTVTSSGGSMNLYPAGQEVTLNRISGHRDGDSTDCPGGALYEQLPEIRTGAANQSTGSSKPQPASVSLSATRTTVRLGATAKLRGRVGADDGTAIANRRVLLQSARGHGWRTFRRLRTNRYGLFALRFAPSAGAAYRARLSGSGKVGRLKSPTVRLKVRPRRA